MENAKRIESLGETKYQELFGIHKQTFDKMLSILEEAHNKHQAYKEQHRVGGRPSRLSVLDKLIIMVGYYHDYRTMTTIAFDYGVSKSRISDAGTWVEQTLLKDGTFSLPSKRQLLKTDSNIAIALLDVTECEIQRPQKNKSDHIRARTSATH